MPPRKTTRTYRKRSTGRTLRTTRTTGRTTTRTTNRTTRTPQCTYSCNSPKFLPTRNECQQRMGSYRNVYTQIAGGNKTLLSPTTANKWLRYVNNGSRVYKWTTNEFTRHFGKTNTQGTPTAVRRYLRTKYGAQIQDVTRGRSNCWLVATKKPINGRPFNSYAWK